MINRAEAFQRELAQREIEYRQQQDLMAPVLTHHAHEMVGLQLKESVRQLKEKVARERARGRKAERRGHHWANPQHTPGMFEPMSQKGSHALTTVYEPPAPKSLKQTISLPSLVHYQSTRKAFKTFQHTSKTQGQSVGRLEALDAACDKTHFPRTLCDLTFYCQHVIPTIVMRTYDTGLVPECHALKDIVRPVPATRVKSIIQ